MILVGCCGFSAARKKYYMEFPVVEVQQTFYQPPKLETVLKWKAEAPADFKFAIKAWQLITHEPKSPTYKRLSKPIPEKAKRFYGSFKPTDEVFSAWQKTEEAANALKAEVILFQCPASFKPTKENKENMISFFKKIKRGDYLFAWEPRGEWKEEEIISLCKEFNLIHCVDPFKGHSLYGKPAYLRLHGKEGYDYQYTEDDLVRLKKEWKSKEAVILFNNVTMYEDAKAFLAMLKGD